MDKLLTYKEASKLLRIPISTMYTKVHNKTIPHRRLSARHVRFSEADLNAWLEKCKVPVGGLHATAAAHEDSR